MLQSYHINIFLAPCLATTTPSATVDTVESQRDGRTPVENAFTNGCDDAPDNFSSIVF